MDIAVNLDPGLKGSVQFSDLVMVNGDLTATSDVAGGTTHPVLQDVSLRLRTFQGECFMDSTLGIPWRQLADAGSRAQTQLDAVVQNVILTTPGVIQLSDYESSLNSRQRILQLSFKAVSTRGPINYSTQVNTTADLSGASA